MISLSELLGSETNLDILAGKTGSLYNVLNELQGLVVTTVAGANANTNIAVTGITTSDTLVGVIEFTVNTGNLTSTVNNRLSTTSITSAGNIQCTQSTSGSVLLVLWYDKV
jgi:asparagine N-glycosylation enzyme membrane subunit Stt3